MEAVKNLKGGGNKIDSSVSRGNNVASELFACKHPVVDGNRGVCGRQSICVEARRYESGSFEGISNKGRREEKDGKMVHSAEEKEEEVLKVTWHRSKRGT